MDRKGKTSKQQLKGTRFFVSIAIEWFCIRRFSCTGEAAAAARPPLGPVNDVVVFPLRFLESRVIFVYNVVGYNL